MKVKKEQNAKKKGPKEKAKTAQTVQKQQNKDRKVSCVVIKGQHVAVRERADDQMFLF